MTPLVEYWLKANLYLLLFFGLYSLLLRRHTFLTLNRTYLLGSLGLALVLPFLHVPGLSVSWFAEAAADTQPALANVPVNYVPDEAASKTVTNVPVAAAPLLRDWPVLAYWAFALVAAGLLLRTGWRTVSLLRFIRQWPARPVHGTALSNHTLVLPDDDQTPTFSFFRYLVLNPADAHTEAVRQHELVHIRQWHSVDVLLLEVIQALFWPNPALIGYRRAIRQVHEYLADRDAIAPSPDQRDAYARFLVNYVFHVPGCGTTTTDALAHSFGPARPDSPTLKQRIQMLYAQHTNRRALWKYALVLPLAATLLAMTTKPEAPIHSILAVKATEYQPVEKTVELPTSGKLPGSTAVDLYVRPLATSRVRAAGTTIRVEGYVKDRSGNALPGANVALKKGTIGTTTDASGRFLIDVPVGSKLIASFIGFIPSEMSVPTPSVRGGEGPDVLMLFKLRENGSKSSIPSAVTQDYKVIEGDVVRVKGENEVFGVVEQSPIFPGGVKKMYDYINSNLMYPSAASRALMEGKVFINFVVNADGSIDRVNILKGIGFGCDEEAIRLIKAMPNWIPGKQNGRPVAVRYNLPVTFSLKKKGDGKKVGLNSTGQPENIKIGGDYRSPTGTVALNGAPAGISILKDDNLVIGDNLIIGGGTRSNPLYILDGLEIDDISEKLHPKDIAEINVLKDASAKATYGEKGSNGVVIIKTKKFVEAEAAKERNRR